MRRALAAALVSLGVAGSAAAHDFWLDLSPWRFDRLDTAVSLNAMVGTTAEREPWTVRLERVVALRAHGPGGVTDYFSRLRATAPSAPGGAKITFDAPGTHIVALETTPADSDLPAAEFDAYVAHEGLSAVAAHRAGKPPRNGRETYARRAKALVQIGEEATANALRPIGQSLEIVPLVNPHTPATTTLNVRVLYRGRPLAGALVHRESLSDPRTQKLSARSDASGHASFPNERRGAWKIATVWSEPIADTRRADYDTLFASLSYGF